MRSLSRGGRASCRSTRLDKATISVVSCSGKGASVAKHKEGLTVDAIEQGLAKAATTRAKTSHPPARSGRVVKRGLLSVDRGTDRRRTVVETRAVDEVGEIAPRRRAAADRAFQLG